jgi:hypothetical protein
VSRRSTVAERESVNGQHSRRRGSSAFVHVMLLGLVLVPLFGAFLRFIVFLEPQQLGLVVLCDMLTLGVILPLVAVGVGYRVTKRVPFVIWHVALTAELFAVSCAITVSIGWPADTAPWWDRLWAVVAWPAWWAIVHLFGSLAISLSWTLYRIDALRSNPRDGGETKDTWGELLGLGKARPIVAKAVIDEHAVEVPIETNGTPVRKIQDALPIIEEGAKVLRGRSTVIGDVRGGSATLRFVHTDPMKVWRTWPGLSHPGASFALPFRTAYYNTGPVQWYSFARTPDGLVSHLAPEFRSANDAHLGRQGATRAGKSGDIQCEAAEALSRRDAVLILLNAAKLMQDSGWCLDMATLAADTKRKAKMVFAALRRLGEHRSQEMGRHGFRTMTPEAYDKLGFPYVLIQVDEGDLLLSGEDVTWLATKGLSLGIYSSLSLSQATTANVVSSLRSAITQWKCFGTGVDYDQGFVLSDETQAAGADPYRWGTRFPGAHYLDRAQGVDEKLYPVDARSYQTRQDFADLRRDVEAARATFTPATFSPPEVEVLGDAWKFCQPSALLFGARDDDDDDTTPAQSTTGGHPTTERIDMEATQQLPPADEAELIRLEVEAEDFDPTVPDIFRKPRADFSEELREYGPANPRVDDPPYTGPDEPLVDAKPRAGSAEQVVAEFNAALVRLAARGVTEFTNSDVIEEMRVACDAPVVSRRLKGLCAGELLPPEGHAVARLGRGKFSLIRMSDSVAN